MLVPPGLLPIPWCPSTLPALLPTCCCRCFYLPGTLFPALSATMSVFACVLSTRDQLLHPIPCPLSQGSAPALRYGMCGWGLLSALTAHLAPLIQKARWVLCQLPCCPGALAQTQALYPGHHSHCPPVNVFPSQQPWALAAGVLPLPASSQLPESTWLFGLMLANSSCLQQGQEWGRLLLPRYDPGHPSWLCLRPLALCWPVAESAVSHPRAHRPGYSGAHPRVHTLCSGDNWTVYGLGACEAERKVMMLG